MRFLRFLVLAVLPRHLWWPFAPGEDVEAKAWDLMQNSKWSMQDMDELLHALHPARLDHFRMNMRKAPRGKELTRSFSTVFGVYAHGAFVGVTKSTSKYPCLVKYINSWLRHHAPEASFSSFSIGANVQGPAAPGCE